VGATGHVKVSFVYPIDTNDNPDDGRIYLKDHFIFDPQTQTLELYWRRFDYQGEGPWQGWVERYRATVKDQDVGGMAPGLREAATRIGQSFGRPISSALSQRIKEQRGYFNSAAEAVAAVPTVSGFGMQNPDRLLTVVERGDKLEVTLGFPLDDDKNPKNGRIFLYDKFTLDQATRRLEKVERDWRVAPEVEKEKRGRLQEAVKQLKGRGSPTVEEAGPFVAAILEEALKPVEVEADEFTRLIPPVPDTARKRWPEVRVGSWGERMARRGELKRGQEEGQEIYRKLQSVLSAELQEKQADKDKGWAPGFLKEVLTREIPREGLEAKLKSICAEPDAEIRAESLLQFAREDLLLGHELSKTPEAIAGLVKGRGQVQAEAASLFALLRGEGNVGGKVELLVPKLVGDFLGSGLAAMVAAPFGGTALQGLVLAPFQKTGFLGLALAVLIGGVGEAATFAGVRRFFASAFHDPAELLDLSAIFTESKAMFLPFLAMHGGHTASLMFTSRMAESQLLRPLLTRGKPVWQFPSLPGRHAWMLPVAAAPLTPVGERLAGFFHHGMGLAAMVAVDEIGYLLKGGQPHGAVGSFFDAALMYLHAVVGFKLADGLTAGRLQHALGEMAHRMVLRRESLRLARSQKTDSSSPTVRLSRREGDRPLPDEIVPGWWHPRDGTSPEPPSGLSLQNSEALLANARIVRQLAEGHLEISLQGQGRGNLDLPDFWDFWQLARLQTGRFRDHIPVLREAEANTEFLAFYTGRIETQLSHSLHYLHERGVEPARVALESVEALIRSVQKGMKHQAALREIRIDAYQWGESGPRVEFGREAPPASASATTANASSIVHPEVWAQIQSDMLHFEQSLVGQIPGLTPELEGGFRAGGWVREKEGSYELVTPNKDIQGTDYHPLSRDEYQAYLAWMEQTGFGNFSERGIPGDMDHAATVGTGEERALLSQWATSKGLHIMGSSFSPQLTYLHTLLSALPETLWQAKSPDGRSYLEGIWLRCDSSAGTSPIRFSALERGTIHLSRDVLNGSRHLLMAALLREIGRTTAYRYRLAPRPAGPQNPPRHFELSEESPWDIPPDKSIPLQLRKKVREAVQIVTEGKRGFALLLPYRRLYSDPFEGFIANFHLHYFAQGKRLRAHIRDIGDENIRKRYEFLYHEIQSRVFNGREYP
jgi:hypothetical protein